MVEVSAERMAEFHRKGFVEVPGVLDKDAISKMHSALSAANEIQDKTWGDNPYYLDKGMVHNPMIYDPVFMDVFRNDVMHAYLEAALDPHCILYAFTTSSMAPSADNYSSRVHVDCPRVIPGYITNVGFLIALDDFTAENGATYFLPNSFERTEPPGEEEFFRDAQRTYLKAGDAVIFNARTWHYGGANKTQNVRHALTLNVCRSYMKQRFDYPRLLGEEKLKTLDERSLKFLGYRTRTPVSLEDYYVPPEQRLYFPGQG